MRKLVSKKLVSECNVCNMELPRLVILSQWSTCIILHCFTQLLWFWDQIILQVFPAVLFINQKSCIISLLFRFTITLVQRLILHWQTLFHVFLSMVTFYVYLSVAVKEEIDEIHLPVLSWILVAGILILLSVHSSQQCWRYIFSILILGE